MLTATCCRCATRRRKRKPKWRAPPLPPSAPWEVDGMRDLQAAAPPPRLWMQRDSNINPFMTEDGVHAMTTTDDSWVLITGASSGFGAEFARQYAAQGHSLVLVARRLDRLETLAEELRQQYGIDVVVQQVDLSDIAAVIQLHQRLRERGIAVDILINNAGHGRQGTFVDDT